MSAGAGLALLGLGLRLGGLGTALGVAARPAPGAVRKSGAAQREPASAGFEVVAVRHRLARVHLRAPVLLDASLRDADASLLGTRLGRVHARARGSARSARHQVQARWRRSDRILGGLRSRSAALVRHEALADVLRHALDELRLATAHQVECGHRHRQAQREPPVHVALVVGRRFAHLAVGRREERRARAGQTASHRARRASDRTAGQRADRTAGQPGRQRRARVHQLTADVLGDVADALDVAHALHGALLVRDALFSRRLGGALLALLVGPVFHARQPEPSGRILDRAHRLARAGLQRTGDPVGPLAARLDAGLLGDLAHRHVQRIGRLDQQFLVGQVLAEVVAHVIDERHIYLTR